MNRWLILLSALLVIVFTGCQEQAEWHTHNVLIDMDVTTVSSGYVHASFTPNKDCYYAIGVMPVNDGFDPIHHDKQFMSLMVDSMYASYLAWRYDHLKQGEEYIASFSSHCLQYGVTDYYFENLTPEKDYWVYCFVVDPDHNQPAGDLKLATITTKKMQGKPIRFDARVDSTFIFVYPRDTVDNKLVDNIPYSWGVVDSVTLYSEYSSITEYTNEVYELYQHWGLTGERGVSFENLDFMLEKGCLYYLYAACIDGGMTNRTVFKFIWDGPQSHITPQASYREY